MTRAKDKQFTGISINSVNEYKAHRDNKRIIFRCPDEQKIEPIPMAELNFAAFNLVDKYIGVVKWVGVNDV